MPVDLADRVAALGSRMTCWRPRLEPACSRAPSLARCRRRRTSSRDRPQPADARPGRRSGSRAGPSSGNRPMRLPCRSADRSFDARRLPVRRDVLSRQGAGLPGGAPGPAAGRALARSTCGTASRDNEFADIVTQALAELFPDDPPRFLARTPHGHHDVERIRQDLAAAGFARMSRSTAFDARSGRPSARHVAVAYCQGTPLRNEIEARDAVASGGGHRPGRRLHVARRFGPRRSRGPASAPIVVSAS